MCLSNDANVAALSLVLITRTMHAHAALQEPKGPWWVKNWV